MHILDEQAPGLADRLSLLPLDTRKTIVAMACCAASECVKRQDESMSKLVATLRTRHHLDKHEVEIAGILAQEMDAKYLDSQSRGEDSAAVELFSKARFFTALSVGFGNESSNSAADAVYELCNACDDPTPIIRVIESQLSKLG